MRIQVAFAGALMCVMTEDDIESWNIFVTNVVTKRCRRLPQPPYPVQLGGQFSPEGHVTILLSEASGYRVFVLHWMMAVPHEMQVQVYDSKLQAWTVREPNLVHSASFYNENAYLDEKIYLMCEPGFGDTIFLWVYDICKNLWTRLPDSLTLAGVINGAVLRCGEKIMVAVALGTDENDGNFYSMTIYELLPSSLRLKYLDTSSHAGDPHIWDLDVEYPPFFFASDADFLYFRQAFPANIVATFNVHTHEWNSLRPGRSSHRSTEQMALGAFEPGLNPFVEV